MYDKNLNPPRVNLKISNFRDLQNASKTLDDISSGASISIDISDYNTFIRPLFVTNLAQFIRYYRINGFNINEIITKEPTACDRADYLHNIGFIEGFKKNFEISIKPSGDYLPITRIDLADLEEKKAILRNYLKKRYPNKDFTALEICIDELVNNCYDHANSKTAVIVHAQIYKKNEMLLFAICDTGIGIPTCVNNFMKKSNKSLLSSPEAIEWAFEYENTTHSARHNRGRGLDTLLSIIQANNGRFRVITGDQYLYFNKEKRYNEIRPYFGTAFEFEIPLKALDDMELQDFDL